MTLAGISSMATRHVLSELATAYERKTGVPVKLEAVGGLVAERRVEAGEPFDFVVLAAAAIDKLAASGRVVADASVDFVHSGMAVAVRAGAAQPDISSGPAVRAAVAGARAVGYSTGPSGNHVLRLVEQWGIAPRLVQSPPGVPVAGLLVRGEADIGFQQMSELLDMPGIDVVGPLPADIQEITLFQAAICTASSRRDETRALLAYFASEETAEVKRRYGMEP